MANLDYYKVLGVDKGASLSDIKNAYRRLAMKHHPDKNKNDKESEKKFKEINEAFSVLGDKQKRQAYDSYGHSGLGGMGGNGGGGWSGDFSDLGDIFESVFGGRGGPFEDAFSQARGGGGGGRQRQARANDVQYKMDISFEEAFSGCEKKLGIEVQDPCKDCKSTGAKDGTALKDCLACGGTGTRVSGNGFLRIQNTCSNCRGKGKIIEERCSSCNGKGVKSKTKNLEVKIPAGIDNGNNLVLRGEATYGDAIPGDVYVYVNVKPHPIMERDGDNLLCTVATDIFDATLGCELEIPTIGEDKKNNNRILVKIPAGTQNGKIFRLRGKGMPRVNSSFHGDLLVRVKVETPVNLSGKQSKLIKELRDSLKGDKVNHSPNTKSWHEKLKSLFK